MDIRKGFDRFSRVLLALIWIIFFAVAVATGDPVWFGTTLVYMLLFTVFFMVACKGIAWVYNGFTSK